MVKSAEEELAFEIIDAHNAKDHEEQDRNYEHVKYTGNGIKESLNRNLECFNPCNESEGAKNFEEAKNFKEVQVNAIEKG